MQQRQPPQLFARLIRRRQLRLRQIEKGVKGVGDGRHQDFIFAFETGSINGETSFFNYSFANDVRNERRLAEREQWKREDPREMVD